MAALDTAARGLAAGFAGTVALTVSQRIEMSLTGRPPSDLPAQVAEGVLGIRPRGRRREQVAFATHWVNNTASGLGRAALGAVGLRGAPAVAGTFLLYMGGGALLFSRLELAQPGPLAIDAIHAGVYAVATSTAYELLERPRDRSQAAAVGSVAPASSGRPWRATARS
jgi:hypothetical protein